MKVKELIARLRTLDPEAEILTNYDSTYSTSEPIPVPVGIVSDKDQREYNLRYGLRPTDYLFLSDEGLDKDQIHMWDKLTHGTFDDDYDKQWCEETFDEELTTGQLRRRIMQESDRQLKAMLKGIPLDKLFPDDPDFAQRATPDQILHRIGFCVPIDEARLSELAWEHAESMDIACRYEEAAAEGYKAGFRKAIKAMTHGMP